MNRLDRYFLVTAGGAFVAVLVVLTGMIWVSQALRRFDLLTSQGQTLWVFFVVTGLSLPTLMMVIAPIALFIAIAYTYYKLNSDSELIVMSAAGLSPWQVVRAPFVLSLAVSLLTLLIAADLSPRSLRTLRDLLSNVNADIVTNVAIPGRFTSIERGLTFHVRERAPGGVLLGIFLHDERNPDQTTTYLADRGRIVPTGSGMFLVLEQGSMHRGGGSGRNASMVEFERYAFDLSQFNPASSVNTNRPGFRKLSELLWPDPADPLYRSDPKRFNVELHKRLSAPLYPLAGFIIAFAFLGSPQTTRQGRGLAISSACLAFLMVEVIGLGSAGIVERNEQASPLPYLVPAVSIGVACLSIAGIIQTRVPAPLQRLADSVAARFERLKEA